jgi:putative ABC transport system permease protein
MVSEGARSVPVRFTNGLHTHRGTVEGVMSDANLSLVYDVETGPVGVPAEGLVLSTRLARKLGVGIGDTVRIEVLERHRPVVHLPVVRTFETYIGTPAYMNIDALSAIMRERRLVNSAHLLVDPALETALYDELKDLPAVTSVLLREAAVNMFYDTIAETLTIYVTIFIGFACVLTFGVVYNSARIALSERGRELATLRVLGFSRFEISYILLGEIGILALGAMPLGAAVGRALSLYMVQGFDTELYRVPSVIDTDTYGFAVAVGLAAAAISALVVRRRLDRLDLIAVLKTRE